MWKVEGVGKGQGLGRQENGIIVYLATLIAF